MIRKSVSITRIFLIAGTLLLLPASLLPAENVTFSDPLTPVAEDATNGELNRSPLAGSGVAWVATKGMVRKQSGATSAAPGSAHFPIPVIAGKIRVEADVRPGTGPWTGVAVGRGNLSGDFWANVAVMATLSENSWSVLAAGKILAGKQDKVLVKPDQANHLMLTVDTIARTATLSVNDRIVAEKVALPEAVRLDEISSAGFRFQEPLKAADSPQVAGFRVGLESLGIAGLAVADPGMFFVGPEKEALLEWTAGSRGAVEDTPFVIRGYRGEKVSEGRARFTAEGKLALRQKFGRGYWEIELPVVGKTFGVVAMEPHQGKADPFFAIDAGLSWLERDEAKRQALVKIAARSGISIVRERLGLSNVTAGEGKFNFDGGRGFDVLRKMYQQEGVQVLEMLDGGKPLKQGEFGKAGKALEGVADHWKMWGGVEAANEPDLQPVPANEYVPLVKVMSHALAEAGGGVPLVAGVFATIPPGPYFDTCVANGMLEDCNRVSFHSYDRANGVESMVRRYRTWLKEAGREAMPLWHTECGWSWRNGPARPPVDQDSDSAMEISAKAMETRVCGVERHFPFVFTYYEEGLKNFSMMGREVTPLRSMAAYANCIRQLSGKDYVGDLKGINAPVKLARVFRKPGDTECLVVLYTGKVGAGTTVRFPGRILQASGADGRTLPADGGSLDVGDGLVYVTMAAADAEAMLDTDTTAMSLYRLGKHPAEPTRRASPLVLQFVPEKTPSRPSSRRYLISRETAREFPLHVKIHNLSGTPVGFTPEVELPGAAGSPLAAVTVPAMGSAEVSWKLDISQSLDIARTKLVKVCGKAAGIDAQPLPLAIPLMMEGGMEEHLARHTNQNRLPIHELGKWKQNIAGHGRAVFSGTAAAGWKMDMTFSTATGSWVYPIFGLPEPVDPARYSGILIRAKISGAASNVAVIAGTPGAPSFWVPDLFPADGEWHVAYVPFAEFKPGPGGVGDQNTRLDPAAWRTLSVGLNSRTKENTMEVSDLILVGGE